MKSAYIAAIVALTVSLASIVGVAYVLVFPSTQTPPINETPRKVRAYTFELLLAGFKNGQGEYPNGTAISPTTINPTLIVLANETLRITGTSMDLLHNMAIYQGGATPGDVFPPTTTPPKLIKRSANIFVDSTSTLDWNPTTPGTYEYYCEYHDTTMHGKIAVLPST